MNELFTNLLLFIGLCFIIFIVFRYLNYKEGMTGLTTDSVANGLAGNASTHAAKIKTENTKLNDSILIDKYRSHYENSILHLDDYVNNLMLKTVMTFDHSKPHESLQQLNNLHQSKAALDSVMSYIDKQ